MLPALLRVGHYHGEPVQQSISDCRQLLSFALYGRTGDHFVAVDRARGQGILGHTGSLIRLVLVVRPVLVFVLKLYSVVEGSGWRLGRCLHRRVLQIFVVLVVELDVLGGKLILVRLLLLHWNVIRHHPVLIAGAVVFPLRLTIAHIDDDVVPNHVYAAVRVIKHRIGWPEGRFVVCLLLLLANVSQSVCGESKNQGSYPIKIPKVELNRSKDDSFDKQRNRAITCNTHLGMDRIPCRLSSATCHEYNCDNPADRAMNKYDCLRHIRKWALSRRIVCTSWK